MDKKYLCVPHWMIESKDKYLVQNYVVVQYMCKKSPVQKSYICKERMIYELGLPKERIRKQFAKFRDDYFPMNVCGGGILLGKNDFDMTNEGYYEMLGDEVELLLQDASLLFHYLVMLKVACGHFKTINSLDNLAEIEGVNEKTIRRLNDKLKELGLISVKRRMNGCNEYIIKYNEEDNPFD